MMNYGNEETADKSKSRDYYGGFCGSSFFQNFLCKTLKTTNNHYTTNLTEKRKILNDV